MTVPFWCLFIGALVPTLLAFTGGYFKSQQFDSVDNNNPREQSAQLTGAGARAVAAQSNAWEALAVFTAAVTVNHLGGGAAGTAAGAATAAPLSKPVTVTGKTMIMTLDVSAGGSVAVTVVSSGAPFATSTPLKANGTDAALTFSKDLAPLVGKQVQLQLAVSNAVVYTVGFRA